MSLPRRSRKQTSQFPQEHRDVLLKLPSLDECCTPQEIAFWQATLGMALSGSTPREVSEFAAAGLDEPLLSHSCSQIRTALTKWARMGDTWAPWDRPEDSDHLRTIPKARDMGYERDGVMSLLRGAPRSSGAGEDWFKHNRVRIRSMQPDYAVRTEPSFAEVVEDHRALSAAAPTRLVGPPAV